MRTETLFQLLFAAGILVVAGSLAAAALERVPRIVLLVLTGALGAAATASWVAFGVDPGRDAAVAAAGLTATVAAELGALALQRGLARARTIDEELVRVQKRLGELVENEVQTRAAELERTLTRARSDSISLLADEERRIAEERRREVAEREQRAGASFAAALLETERRIEQRLASWAGDIERVQEGLSTQLARLEERQRQLIGEAEARLRSDIERLEAESEDQRGSVARVRADLDRSVHDAEVAATSELDDHTAERRRALRELEERMRRREDELRERIGREEGEAIRRIEALFADVERRQVEQLKRVGERAVARYSEAAALQFDASAKAAREQAAVRLSRELDKAIESVARESHAALAERVAQVSDTGVHRVEKRLSQLSAGVERQRDELIAGLERRMAETEHELRVRLQKIAAEGEAERAVLEARLNELARRIDDSFVRARGQVPEEETLGIE